MRGIPKHYNTKQDFYNVAKSYPKDAASDLKKLIDGRFTWQTMGNVASIDDGITDATHKVIETQDENQSTVFVQMELIEDKNARLFQLGWTVDTANAFIGQYA